ncbi:MAG: SMC-Scp complex subunit ScpB [Candidatus Micrarchaeota archaeon]|nr:SMC-Scp complex subunit ScpB [Candidatus Micrarchaeota archaeon]
MAEEEPKRIIEAALFMSSKALSIRELASVSGIAAPGFVTGLVEQLIKEYEERGSALGIFNESGSYIMRVRPEYSERVASFAKEAEISKMALKVLAMVAKRKHVEQSKLVKMMGSTVYDGVKELQAKGFLSAEKTGRTKMLRPTRKFKEYFQGEI